MGNAKVLDILQCVSSNHVQAGVPEKPLETE